MQRSQAIPKQCVILPLGGPTHQISRKLLEAMVALRIELQFTKQQILELYNSRDLMLCRKSPPRSVSPKMLRTDARITASRLWRRYRRNPTGSANRL
jgi:hypothetical protein